MKGVIEREKVRSDGLLIRMPEKLVNCFCRECGTFQGHINYYNGYGDFRCRKCDTFEIFVSDEDGALVILSEGISA